MGVDKPEGFPGGSGDKESACNAVGSAGEGNGYPLQYSCLESSLNRGDYQATVYGVAESDTTEILKLPFFQTLGQGSLACCSPWGCRVGHNLATERLKGGSGAVLMSEDASRLFESCLRTIR